MKISSTMHSKMFSFDWLGFFADTVFLRFDFLLVGFDYELSLCNYQSCFMNYESQSGKPLEE